MGAVVCLKTLYLGVLWVAFRAFGKRVCVKFSYFPKSDDDGSKMAKCLMRHIGSCALSAPQLSRAVLSRRESHH